MRTFAVLLTLPTVKDMKRGLIFLATYVLEYQDGELTMAGFLVTFSSFVIASNKP